MPPDGRLLVYRSEDIRNLSRLASPKVCGYIHAGAQDLLPESARGGEAQEGKMDCVCVRQYRPTYRVGATPFMYVSYA